MHRKHGTLAFPHLMLLGCIVSVFVGCVKENIVDRSTPPGSFVGESSTVIDIDGNIYRTRRIGSVMWMTENLRTTHYANGVAIPEVTGGQVWGDLTSGARCAYANEVSNVQAFGLLYNHYAVVNSNDLCPTGWRVPTNGELTELVNLFGGSSIAGGPLKESGTIHWNEPNVGATNSSGFGALPGGSRSGGSGSFNSLNYSGGYWASGIVQNQFNVAYVLSLYSSGTATYQNHNDRQAGYCVRCVTD